VSTWVHTFASLQIAPSAFGGLLQTPVTGLHVPTSWHGSDAVQVTGLLPMQLPAWQVSDWVHAFASLQIAPSAFGGLLHTPVAGLHVPASWH
jgi:hypothetical protein